MLYIPLPPTSPPSPHRITPLHALFCHSLHYLLPHHVNIEIKRRKYLPRRPVYFVPLCGQEIKYRNHRYERKMKYDVSLHALQVDRVRYLRDSIVCVLQCVRPVRWLLRGDSGSSPPLWTTLHPSPPHRPRTPRNASPDGSASPTDASSASAYEEGVSTAYIDPARRGLATPPLSHIRPHTTHSSDLPRPSSMRYNRNRHDTSPAMLGMCAPITRCPPHP